jgi:hypothetical protein
MITFKSSDVEINKEKLPTTNYLSILEKRSKYQKEIKIPEAFALNNQDSLISSDICNNFVGTIHIAYDKHYPLIISPDDLWVILAQGFANHVNANAENLRHKFVSHKEKEIIRILCPGFVKGSPDNNWQGVFPKFSDKIAEYIGKQRDLIVSNFSTTGPIEEAVSQICLMDTMKQYFDYRCKTCCGIPEITLLGTVDDWKSIENRFLCFGEYDLDWWIKIASPIISQFVEASKGNIDKDFWKSFYKIGGGSGGPYISGWIITLFPYLYNYKTEKSDLLNDVMSKWKNRPSMCDGGLTTDAFPQSCSNVPFIWEYYEEEINMQFIGGFVGVTQNDNCEISSVMGWSISEK